ncbi:acetyl-CoA carboxylase [Janibacter cremeus]|uniref:Biotin carboxyl carrier protein of acetyl-CoA carboxylase n=1 Tax=Janibacter cremeus TaxID=1285192 RepID=A0A852VMC1_9MICO|nr:acetyl-CoA carboxylase [Janibacter cremeus]NYF97266.1 biotin carboxyl carrier protein [Janibacter cremeus]
MPTISSPLPGVFYRRPSPDQEVYVNDGDQVTEGQTIGLIEVMKNFTELKATAGGTIKEFLVDDESELSVGQDVAVLE